MKVMGKASALVGLASIGITPGVALAAPGGGEPLVGFGQSVLDFLSGPLAFVIVGIGICIAAISLVMGSRDGLQKAIWALVGGALLFGVDSIVRFIASSI
jgi:type IV secretory pathway VirB2 component (pilin)